MRGDFYWISFVGADIVRPKNAVAAAVLPGR